jgi:hypothetical protein
MKRVALPVTAALAVLVAGCGSSSPANLNTNRVAQSIEQTLLTKRNLKATVTCPQNVKQQKGVQFTCMAVTKQFGTTPFHVTVQNDNGYVTYGS